MDNQQLRVLNDRFDDLYVLTKNPFLGVCSYPVSYSNNVPLIIVGRGYVLEDWKLTTDPRDPDWLGIFFQGNNLLENWPREAEDDNALISPYVHYLESRKGGGYMSGYVMPGGLSMVVGGPLYRATGYFKRLVKSAVWQWIRDNSRMIRPGLKHLQFEWLNRVAHESMNRACGRDLPFRPPYFLPTWAMANTLLEPTVGPVDVMVDNTPQFTGQLFNQTDVMILDPWVKMMQGLEHQVFMYGDGDETLPAVNGKYRWPFGLSMPIPPTVGNIYVHLIQNYLIQVARDMGAYSLSEPVMNSLDTNFALAVVWPESSTSAQVAIGNYAIYGGYGLTYGHPEGPYAGKVFLPNGTVDDAEMRGMMRDVAAYANRQRQIWINQNQAIYQKAKQVVEAGGDLYGLNISQIMDSRIVVTDDGGKVVDVTGSTTITGGSGQGNVVNTEPVTGSNFDTTDYTPGDKNPLEVSKVQVVSLTQNTISSGTGATVSVARDTSPGLVMAQPGSAGAQVIKEAAEARGESVTIEPEKSSFLPVAAVLAIAASLFS